MKTITLIPCLLLAFQATAQKPAYTPQQQIERERKAQVQAQTPPTTPPAAYNINTPEVTNQKVDTLQNRAAQVVPVSADPQNSAGLGGAGTSGTATNTIGAPVNPSGNNKPPARSSNDNKLNTNVPAGSVKVVRSRR